MDLNKLKQEAEEKYNERLKQNGIKVEYRNGTYVDGYMDSAEPREKRIAELEKENAELKHIIATLRQEKDNVSMHAKAMEVVAKTRSDQLTKAKKYIKLLLMNCVGVYESTGKTIAEIQAEAEQFLSEVEK